MIVDMVVRRIFSRGNHSKDFSRGCNSDEIFFYLLETKRTTFLCQKFDRKISDFKIQDPLPLCTLIPIPVNAVRMKNYSRSTEEFVMEHVCIFIMLADCTTFKRFLVPFWILL